MTVEQPARHAISYAARHWMPFSLILLPWILAGLDIACFVANDTVVNAQGNLLYTYADPDWAPRAASHCGQFVGLSPAWSAELHTVVWASVAIGILAVVWCLFRLLDQASWPWVLGAGLTLGAFAAFNIVAAQATLTTAPVRMTFGCG